MDYSELIEKCHNINDIIDVCHEAIPKEHKAMPWKHPELISVPLKSGPVKY